MRKLPRGEKLRKCAEKLGVSQDELGTESGLTSEPILQKRVIEALRSRREHTLWLIALISAIASVFSALAAWFAVSLLP
jgi:hypothetical protein